MNELKNNKMLRKSQNNLRKKAQLEMIGLIVIVIIVITGLLVFTVYKITNPTKDIQKRYVNKEIATNMLISMTKTNIYECHNLSLADLIIDCARTYSSIICIDDKLSCEVVNTTIYNILNKTLIDWEMSFNLSIENTNITFVNHACTSKKEKIQSSENLPLGAGQTVEMILDICE